MPDINHPGVYLQDVNVNINVISGCNTHTSVFVGPTTCGPVDTLVRIDSYRAFCECFGELEEPEDALRQSLKCYFNNGGEQALVGRLIGNNSQIAKVVVAGVDSRGKPIEKALQISAKYPGQWANDYHIVIEQTNAKTAQFNLLVQHRRSGAGLRDVERFRAVSLEKHAANHVHKVLEQQSKLVRCKVLNDRVSVLKPPLEPVKHNSFSVGLNQHQKGGDGSELSAGHYLAFLQRHGNDLSQGNILILPGQYWQSKTARKIIREALRFCEKSKHLILIADLQPTMPLNSQQDVDALELPRSAFFCCYFPWVNEFIAGANPRVVVARSPCAFAAALWARTDAQRGVWKAPAGLEAQLVTAHSLTNTVSDEQLIIFNAAGINSIRTFPGKAAVLWGAKTTSDDPHLAYIHVQRLMLYIKQSILRSTKWFVFEANAEALWRTAINVINSFLRQLFRQGAFSGATEAQAFFVTCGLGKTMTQVDINNKRLIIELGVAAVRPAEFVNVQLRYTMSG